MFSGDVEYQMLIDEESESSSKQISSEYKYNFVNVTVNLFDSAPMKLIDFELFFMLISMSIFWMFVGVLFYELWWFPNQLAQGNTPLPTQEWVAMIYREYGLANYYVLREKVLQTPNPMGVKSKEGSNGYSGNHVSSGRSAKKQKSKNDGWLTGTSVSSKNKKKKKRN